MNYLVDTHILLWSMLGSQRLSQSVLKILENQEGKDTFYFSQISLFEIAIKQRIGKLPDFPLKITAICEQLLKDGYAFLPLKNDHIESYQSVPLYEEHRDPFDRLLIAIAHQEDMTIITADKKIKLYQQFVKIVLNAS